MKNMKKLLGLSLAGALVAGTLAGCGAPKTVVDPGDIAYQTAGITRDTVLYTVDGENVTADEYLFWLLSSVSEQKQNGGLADDAAWSGEIEGVPAIEFLKNDALEASKLYAVMEKRAADAGVTLTEEDTAAMNDQIAQVTSSLEQQGATFTEWLDQQCISEATFQRFNTIYYLNQNMIAKLSEEGGELAVTDEKMQAFLDEAGIYKAKHILLSTQHTGEDGTKTAYSAEEKAVVKAEADALVAEIRAAADPLATFDEKMNARSDDGRDETGALGAPDGYLAYPQQMVAEFETAALALTVGEIGDPVESEFGYHIIQRLSADEAQTRELYPSYAMSTLTQKWLEDAVVETTDAFAALDVKAFYDKLTALNEERAAAKEAAAAATATPAPVETPAGETPAPVETPVPSATPGVEG